MLDDARKQYWIEKDAWTSDETVFLLNGVDPEDKIKVDPETGIPILVSEVRPKPVINGVVIGSDINALQPRPFKHSFFSFPRACADVETAIISKKIENFLEDTSEYFLNPKTVIQWAQSHKEKYPNFPFINYEVQNINADKTKNLTTLEKIYLEVKNMYYGAGKFDPKDLETIPTLEEVIKSVQEIGKKHHTLVSRRTAIAFAQMMRPAGVPKGRRPSK